MTSLTILGAAAAAVMFASAPAAAGEWRLNPAKCPDLVEDRIDRSVTRSRADLREDRRDARSVVCPARAWEYHPSVWERVRRVRPAPPAYTVYVAAPGRYYRVKPDGVRVDIRIVAR